MERRLEGGNAGGAVLVEGTVRRATGPWTPVVHALLRHLEQHDFVGVPRVLGIDDFIKSVEELDPDSGPTVPNPRSVS